MDNVVKISPSKAVNFAFDVAFLMDLVFRYGSESDVIFMLEFMHFFCDSFVRYQVMYNFDEEE